MLQNITVTIYLIFMQSSEIQNVDNTTKFWVWYDDKLCEFYETNDFLIVRR